MQRTTCAFSLFFQRREGRHLDDGGRGVRRGDDGRREVRLRDGGGRGVRCGDDGRREGRRSGASAATKTGGRREGRRRDCGGRGVRCGDDGRREGRRRDNGGRGVRHDKDGRREGQRRDDGGRGVGRDNGVSRGDVAPVARVADEEAAAATNEEVKIGLWTSALRGCLFEIIGGVFCSWGLGSFMLKLVRAEGRTW